MVIFILVLSLIVVLAAVYALWVRNWLKSKSWAQPFFAWIEPIEIALFKKSPTILFARLKVLTGVLLAALTSLGGIDLTPIMPFVPDQYEPYLKAVFNLMPLILSVVGWMDESLRKKTTLPIEIVAVPEKVIAENSEVAKTVAEAKSTNVVAIAAIDEAKAA